MRVSVTNYELAEEQVKIEEKQRVLGVIPNFYVSYQQDALPLRPRQKFELAWKTSIDPLTFAASGGASPYTFSITTGSPPAGLTFSSP